MDITDLPDFKDVSGRRIAYVASVLVLLAMIFSLVYEIELKQDVPGEIASQSDIQIEGLTGMVTEIYAQPHSQVQAGTPLFRIDRDFSLSADGRQRSAYDASVRDAQTRDTEQAYLEHRAQLEARVVTLGRNEANLRKEMAVVEQETQQQQKMIGEAQGKLDRLTQASQYVVADRIEQARAELGQLQVSASRNSARVQQLLNEIATNRGTQTELQAQINSLAASHGREMRDIGSGFERDRKDAVISAPQAGTVGFSNVLPGKLLSPDDVAMVISTGDQGELMAALRIPSRQRGFIKEGQTVRLKLDAFPYIRFGTYPARITAISRTPVASARTTAGDAAAMAAAAQSMGERDYIAWVVLSGKTFTADGEQYEILPGMQVTASVVVERRTIAEWVLEPVFRMLRG